VADDAVDRVGALIEQLGARFELVVEAVSGWGGRIESLRDEMRAQFNEVGKQIRFISEQIAVSRQGVTSIKADLTAEIIRLGETLGQSRVDFREQLAAAESGLRSEVSARSEQTRATIADEVGSARAALTRESEALHASLTRDLTTNAAKLKAGLNSSADALLKKLDAELKRATKALATLDKKFDRFDDRITIQTRDQEQRVRKLERGRHG
jgi:hypothetical protein